MDERIARLRAHQKNIERYQSLLKTELTEVEMQYLEKLLSEERFVMGILSAAISEAPISPTRRNRGVEDSEHVS